MNHKVLRFSFSLWVGVTLLTGHLVPLKAQDESLTRGSAGVGLLLRQLDGIKRVLVLGAHPDDEDTSLLSALSRGMGVETAYLSLSRGEGGQNLIGEELDEGLGILRSGELLAARSLDGGRQFFTRAYDFGYSKTLEETLRFWPRDEILGDVTWVVRTFRPHVIVSVFSGTEGDGHGQHQMAGLMAREVFQTAADPSAYPEQIEAGATPWSPSKLYRLSRSGPQGRSTEIETGAFDPLLGRSHHQLAMEARSQHRSQDMGRPEPMGPRISRLILLESRVEENGGERGGFFEGIDTTLTGLAGDLKGERSDVVRRALRRYGEALQRAREEFSAGEPWRSAPWLLKGAEALHQARSGLGEEASGELSHVLDSRIPLVELTALRSAGIVMDVRLEDDLLVPGEEVGAVVELWNGGPLPLSEVRLDLDLPGGWTQESTRKAGPLIQPGEVGRWGFTLRVSEEMAVSRPYFLERPREGELYRWPQEPGLWGMPVAPPLVHAGLSVRVGESGRVVVRQPAVFRGVDKATGEFVKPLLVVPALSVSMNPGRLIWPLGSREARSFTVRVRNQAGGGEEGDVSLLLPPGWKAEPDSHSFSLSEAGDEASFVFSVSAPENLTAGVHRIRAQVVDGDGREYGEGVMLVDYPHIPRGALFTPSLAEVSAFPVSVREGVRVGYIMGSGDLGAEALRQMGVQVELLGPEEVIAGAFEDFHALVLGIRAYETRPDVVAANDQLLEFGRRGGTLIVQYNKYEFPRGGFAPYPVEMARPHDRVADEEASVAVLDPDHPLFLRPNRITSEDFEGWVQERGLYFLNQWDPAYTPLLEMADPGEEPKQGGLLVAPLGEGLYVYTGLAFFRQVPEGVPGAMRLLANLVSLSRDDVHE